MLNKAQRQYIKDCFEVSVEYLLKIIPHQKWDDLLNIIKIENVTDEQINNFLKPLVGEDKKAYNYIKLIHKLYFLTEQREGFEQFQNEKNPATLEEWQSAVIVYLETTIDNYFEGLSDNSKQEDIKSKNRNSNDESKNENNKDEVKTKILFKDYEVAIFFEKEEVALKAVKDPEVALRFTEEQLYELSRKYESFALVVCNNLSLLAKLSQLQLKMLAKLYVKVTVFLANNYEKLGIETNVINELINDLVFDEHYHRLYNNKDILLYLVNLATNKEKFIKLDTAYHEKLLGNPLLIIYAFENQKAFEKADIQVFIHLIISYISNNLPFSTSQQQESVLNQIISFIRNSNVQKVITAAQLCKIISSLSPDCALQIFNFVAENNELIEKISNLQLLELAFSITNSFRFKYALELDEGILGAIKSLLDKREFFDPNEVLNMTEAHFKAVVFLIKNDQNKQSQLLNVLKENIVKVAPSRLEYMMDNLKSVSDHIKNNGLDCLSIDYLFKLKEKGSLTWIQKSQLDDALLSKAKEQILNENNIYSLVSIALSSPYHAQAVIDTGKYERFPNVNAGLTSLFKKYPEMEAYYKQKSNQQVSPSQTTPKSIRLQQISDVEAPAVLEQALAAHSLEQTLAQNQFSVLAILKFSDEKASIFSAKQISIIMKFLLAHANTTQIESLVLEHEKFAMEFLLNVKELEKHVKNLGSFLSKVCKKHKAIELYVNSRNDLIPIKKQFEEANQKASTSSQIALANEYDYLFKMQLIGDSGVGKSCLLLRFADDYYTDSYIPTIGLDFKIQTLNVIDKKVKLQIWDLNGDPRYFNFDRSFRGAHAILLVFDVTDRVSFDNIQKRWLPLKESSLGSNVNLILVGTKSDLPEKRVVDFQLAKEYADSLGIPYIETSAKRNIGVTETFTTITSAVLKRFSQNSNKQSLGTSSSYFSAVDLNDLSSMNKRFKELYQQRESASDKEEITNGLTSLRASALTLVEKEKEKYKSRASKGDYLQSLRDLPIFKEHLYIGPFATVKNIGRTNALIKIDGWIGNLDKEFSQVDTLTISQPKLVKNPLKS